MSSNSKPAGSERLSGALTPIIQFVGVTILSAAIVGWWIAEMSGDTIDWTKVFERASTYVLIAYVVGFGLFSYWQFKAAQATALRAKFIEAIWAASIAKANTAIEQGEFETLDKLIEMLEVRK